MNVAAWVGLALAIFDLLLWFALAFGLNHVWTKLRPQVEPLLSMFAPPPPVDVEQSADVDTFE